MSFTTFSQSLTPEVLLKGNDSLFCFTITQSKELAKLVSDGAYGDSIAQVRELEVKEITEMAIRMQHNLDLINGVNNKLREEVALKEGQTVNCEKEKEVIIKSERRDKRRKLVVAFIVGALVGGFAAHF